eukprot:392773-Rhodomonas_salina.1
MWRSCPCRTPWNLTLRIARRLCNSRGSRISGLTRKEWSGAGCGNAGVLRNGSTATYFPMTECSGHDTTTR